MFEESVSSLPSFLASMNSWFTPTVLFVLLNLMIGTIAITSALSTQKHHEPPQEHPQHRQLARSPSMLQRLKSINLYSYRSHEPTTAFHKSPDSENIHAFRQTEQQEQPQFIRSPSFLQKLKSINLQDFISQNSTPKQYYSSTPTLHKTQEPETTHFHFPQTLEQEQPKEDEQKGEQQQQEEVEDEDEQIQEDQYQDEEADQVQTLDEIYSQLKGGHVSRSKSDTKPTSGEVPTKLSKKMRKSASAKSAFAHFETDDVAESRRPATVREGKAKASEADEEVDAKADDFINKFKQQLKLQRLDSIIRYKEMINRGSEK